MNGDTKGRILGLVLLGVFVAFLVKNTASGLVLSVTSANWPRTRAQVVGSTVYRDATDVSPRWEPDVVYQYQVGKQTFTSERIRFLMKPMYKREEAARISGSYTVGSVVPIAFDPANPRESVLEPGVPPGTLKQVLLLLFLISVAGYIYYELRHPARRVLLRTMQSSD